MDAPENPASEAPPSPSNSPIAKPSSHEAPSPFPPGSPFAAAYAGGADVLSDARSLAAFGEAPYRGVQRAAPPVRREARAKTPASPRELVALLVFVLVADVAVYASGGASLPLALGFLSFAGIAAAFARKKQFSLRAVAVTIALVATCGRVAWSGGVGSVLLAALLVATFTVTIRAKRTYLPDLVASVGVSVGLLFGRISSFYAGARALFGKRERPAFPWKTVLVPLGLFVTLGLVFTFANPVIEAWMSRVLGAIHLPSPARPLFWLGAAVVGTAILRPAFRRAFVGTLGRHQSDDAGELVPQASIITARNTLLALNALFLAVNALDAVSLWAGKPPAGLGFTEYAHRGTAWLTVALLLSTVVLGVIFRGAFHHDPAARNVRLLAYGWAAQNVVLALGTFRRIQLYVDVSGLTEARILGIFGTTLVVVGLVLSIRMVAKKRTAAWLVHRQTDAFALFLVAFVATPTEALATSFNVSRISQGQYAPLLHVVEKTSSPESIAPLLPLLSHPDPIVADGVGAMLARREESVRDRRPASLFSGNLQDRSAADALAQVHEKLAKIPPETVQPRVDALRKLAGLANEDEDAFDYRGRGGVRSSDTNL
jgi:hypothetical protein